MILFFSVADGWGSGSNCKFQSDHRQIERIRMVETQMEWRGIRDKRVLEAMRCVPRHQFVPKDTQDLAYTDSPLAIGHQQTISQPYIVAFMTESAQLKPKDRILEIGTGSGYQAAVLSQLVSEVYSIEIIDELANSAKETFKKLEIKNIQAKVGDGYVGWPEHAPFDAIIVTASPDHIPQPFIEQLRVGGRLIIPVGKDSQSLIRVTKTKDIIKRETLLPVAFVPMKGIAEKTKK